MKPLNVIGSSLETCCHNSKNGTYNDGDRQTASVDYGVHTVCVELTEEFLQFAKYISNDSITAMYKDDFEDMVPGTKYCLSAFHWLEAHKAGVAPPVHLESTHISTLEFCNLADLMSHSVI